MALTDSEKGLLRAAICDGAFNNLKQAQVAQGQPMPLTADILTSISAMADDDVRRILIVYQSQKSLILNNQLQKVSGNVATMQAQVTTLASYIVNQPAAPAS